MRLIGLAVVLAITLAVPPLAGEAQSPDRVRRIGVLMYYFEKDPAGQLRATGVPAKAREARLDRRP
jgi:hypothetical protein